MLKLNLLHFNDVYNIEEQQNEPKGGAARFFTAINKYRNNNSLLLFSGDCLNPSMLSNATHGRHMIEILNKFDIDCAVVGNHDFDFGVDNFIECMEFSNFIWLNSNCLDNFTVEPLGNCQTYTAIKRAGLKVGLIGMVENDWVATLSTVDPSDVTVIDFVEESNRLIKILKEKHCCDIIIALTHMRWPNDYILADNAKDIDIILGGHDHNYGVEKRKNCYVIKSGTDFREFNNISITYNTSLKSIDSIDITKVEVNSKFESNPIIAKMVDDFTHELEAKMQQVIGTLDVDLDARFESIRTKETNVGNLIADIMMTAVDADCAIINSGALRSDKIIPAGNFTLKEMSLLLPLIDPILVLEVTGKILYEILENGVSQIPKLEGRFPQVSGIKFSFRSSLPSGSRIDSNSILIQEQKLDLVKKYRIAIKYYMSQGKDGYDMLLNCPILLDDENGPVINTAVQNYFQTINVLKGFKSLRASHYQKLLSKKKVNSGVTIGVNKWGILKSTITDTEKMLCNTSPKVEGRIIQLD